MTRDRMIRKLMEKADALQKNYTLRGWEEIWDMCYDWNSSHAECEEIMLCDHENDDTGLVDGFYIEDDYWVFAD